MQMPSNNTERRALHDRLIRYADAANRTGRTRGVAALVRSIEDPGLRQQVMRWLEKYTPLRRIPGGTRPDLTFYCVPKSLAGMDLGPARLNPYWSEAGPSGHVPTIVPANLKTGGQSEKDFGVVRLRRAFDAYLRDRDPQSRATLIRVIEEVDLTPPHRRSPFLQGGAPSLGRRR